MHGWMSPNFGPTGCVGAIVWIVLMVGMVLGMLGCLWWTVLGG
jgi:hypothetical protein